MCLYASIGSLIALFLGNKIYCDIFGYSSFLIAQICMKEGKLAFKVW